MARHKQSICTTLDGKKIWVDEQLAPFIQKLWDAGVKTWTSCQWDGFPDKVYPAYINPCVPPSRKGQACDWSSPDEMAEILGLERWQWRSRNGVLWLHRSLIVSGET